MSSVCGIDEAGRGALAGPLVAAAVTLRMTQAALLQQTGLPIRDGKLLSPAQRRRIYLHLQTLPIVIRVERITVGFINTHGIQKANLAIIRRLIERTDAASYVVDGRWKLSVKGKTDRVRCVVDADATELPAILAGIVAKVERDAIMQSLGTRHPRYGWDHNAGYGTREHIGAIRAFGVTRHHRHMFVATALTGIRNR